MSELVQTENIAAESGNMVIASKGKISLLHTLANKWNVDADKIMNTLKKTAFKQKEGVEITNEQMMALLIVSNQYDLNPFLKQIYAFPDKGGIVPVVGVDGWAALAARNPSFAGVSFVFAKEVTKLSGAKPCPEWCEVVIYKKGFEYPFVVREYLDEVYREPFKSRDGKVSVGPWQTHTKRMLRHKAYIQGLRIAFGFTGIYDEDEAERIIDITPEKQPVAAMPNTMNATNMANMIENMESTPADLEPTKEASTVATQTTDEWQAEYDAA